VVHVILVVTVDVPVVDIVGNKAHMISADQYNYLINCNSGPPCPAPLSYDCQMGYSGLAADRCCPIDYTYSTTSNSCVPYS
jgi:hypothetical protein